MIKKLNSISLILFLSCFILCLSDSNLDKLNLLKKEQTRIFSALAGANMTSLEIVAGEANEASLKFGSVNNFFSFTARGQYKDFIIANAQKPILQVDKNDNVMVFSQNIQANDGFKYTGGIKIRNVPQWNLVIEEDFSNEAKGWTNNTVTECGGVRMLGGYCQFGGGEVYKVFDNLPPHTHLRIQATFHFIDAWDTESGFMRVNNGKDGEMQYVWIERYSAFIGNNGIDICGGRWPEGKFASPIDVVLPHKATSIKLGFGASIEQDPCDESFGVSGIRIYIK